MPAGSSPTKIDVGRYVAQIELMLRVGGERLQRMQALAILRRWQFDEMLRRCVSAEGEGAHPDICRE